MGSVDDKSLQTLDWHAVRVRLGGQAASPLGRRLAEALQPSVSHRQVRIDLEETGEARALLDGGAPLPLGGVHDIAGALRRAARAGVLEPSELLDVAETAGACRRLRSFCAAHPEAPRLADRAGGLGEFRRLEDEVARCLDVEGRLRDEASPELARVRRQRRTVEGRVRERLDALLRSSAVQPYLQDPIVTLRQDRFVLPVRTENRAHVPGVVHDQSASGATVFVEPMAIVELNNDLRRLAAAEQAEEQRLLAALSAEVAAVAEALRWSLDILAHLDLAAAKGRLSAALDARAPELLSEPALDLRGARHPLIPRPVPIDLRLGTDFDVLVVTGPNTGGKTVSLKTAGLLAVMAQAGLHVPVAEGSRVGVFPQVWCDAGDEQGVEQNLSTFSSHMSRIVQFVRDVVPGALVLLDELGAGTDPAEGAALAMALLERLQARGARVIATTHYSELKAYAYRTPRAENASAEFDPETLRPTYRLITGRPGHSNAFAIAERLGLPPEVTARARELLSPEERAVEGLIAGLADDQRRLADALAGAERERAEAARVHGELEARRRDLEARLRDAGERARQEAEEVLARARREADESLREFRRLRQRLAEQLAEEEGRGGRRAGEAAASAHAPAAVGAGQPAEPVGSGGGAVGDGSDSLEGILARAEAAREAIRAAQHAMGQRTGGSEPRVAAPHAGPWRPGQAVAVRSLRQVGRLLTVPEPGGAALVQVGILRLSVPAGDLEPAGDEDNGGGAGEQEPGGRLTGPASGGAGGAGAAAGVVSPARAAAVSPECDLRGMTAAEALERVDRYLDEAVLAGLSTVRLIHGKGTGALRAAVGEYLRGHPQVESFRLGGTGEGGAGVTVATLRN
jgi:DNA mismatch repair protein MutS2